MMADFFRVGKRRSFLNHGLARARVRRSHFHPRFEIGDLLLGKFAATFARRHLHVFIGVTDRLDQKAFLRIARDNRRARIAALQHFVARVEQQPAFDLFGVLAVALVAMLDEEGPDFLLKKLDACTVGFNGSGRGDDASEQQSCCRQKSCLGDAFLHARS